MENYELLSADCYIYSNPKSIIRIFESQTYTGKADEGTAFSQLI